MHRKQRSITHLAKLEMKSVKKLGELLDFIYFHETKAQRSFRDIPFNASNASSNLCWKFVAWPT
jgi:hypothetical protein